jgi:hypothetical protein
VEPNQQLYLSDQSAASSTNFSSGKLAIAMERGGDTSPGPLFYVSQVTGATPAGEPGLLPMGLMAPGDSFHRTLIIRNTGTLDAALVSVSAELTGGSQLLADTLEVRVTTDAAGAQPVAWGTLSQFLAHPQFFATGFVSLPVGAATALHFWVSLPLGTGNALQGLTATVSFGVTAEQSGHNTFPPPPNTPPELGEAEGQRIT